MENCSKLLLTGHPLASTSLPSGVLGHTSSESVTPSPSVSGFGFTGQPVASTSVFGGVTQVLLVVVRYFGGTLLGVSGLINAYRNAAADALNNADIVEKIIENEYFLDFTYNELNDVMQIIKQENLTIVQTWFEEKCKIHFSVRKSETEKIESIFHNFYGVEISEKEDLKDKNV
jgi:putative IMPACT (imprinted ancient) family translation regulator